MNVDKDKSGNAQYASRRISKKQQAFTGYLKSIAVKQGWRGKKLGEQKFYLKLGYEKPIELNRLSP